MFGDYQDPYTAGARGSPARQQPVQQQGYPAPGPGYPQQMQQPYPGAAPGYHQPQMHAAPPPPGYYPTTAQYGGPMPGGECPVETAYFFCLSKGANACNSWAADA